MILNNELNSKLQIRLDSICNECEINMLDLMSIIEIYCKDMVQLKEEYRKNNIKYSVKKINEDKWSIIDNKKMSILKNIEDEITAYRVARIKEILNSKQRYIKQKLYETKELI